MGAVFTNYTVVSKRLGREAARLARVVGESFDARYR